MPLRPSRFFMKGASVPALHSMAPQSNQDMPVHPPSSNMPQAMNLHPSVYPSPLLRDVGSSSSLDGNSWEQGMPGGARWCVTETGHDIYHGPFSLIFPASNKLTQPVFLKRQVATKKKTVTTTMAETTQWGRQPQLHNHHHNHTQCQKFSSMMSSTSQRCNDNQRAQ